MGSGKAQAVVRLPRRQHEKFSESTAPVPGASRDPAPRDVDVQARSGRRTVDEQQQEVLEPMGSKATVDQIARRLGVHTSMVEADGRTWAVRPRRCLQRARCAAAAPRRSRPHAKPRTSRTEASHTPCPRGCRVLPLGPRGRGRAPRTLDVERLLKQALLDRQSGPASPPAVAK